MLGKFDVQQRLTTDGRGIQASGPITWSDVPGATKITRVKVDFEQMIGGQRRTCSAQTDSNVAFDSPQPRWAFRMDNNGMVPGPVTARGEATLSGGQRITWEVLPTDSDPVTIVPA